MPIRASGGEGLFEQNHAGMLAVLHALQEICTVSTDDTASIRTVGAPVPMIGYRAAN